MARNVPRGHRAWHWAMRAANDVSAPLPLRDDGDRGLLLRSDADNCEGSLPADGTASCWSSVVHSTSTMAVEWKSDSATSRRHFLPTTGRTSTRGRRRPLPTMLFFKVSRAGRRRRVALRHRRPHDARGRERAFYCRPESPPRVAEWYAAARSVTRVARNSEAPRRIARRSGEQRREHVGSAGRRVGEMGMSVA